MASEDSDDEPLSVLAAAKKLNPEKFVENVSEVASIEPRKRKRKSLTPKKLGITIKIRKQRTLPPPPIIERPTDVWLYLKDLNPAGPYSCLLCSDWFINRSKMIMHYVLNHKKDFCGICRYFVPDRQAWQAHVKFHIPWPCSQCIANFPTQITLRQHLSSVHNLVHCRLCHFRLPDDEQYHTHLFQKHNVTNVLIKDEEVLWDFDYEGTTKFICLLCSKPNNLSSTFFAHYMGYHHFTIKCLTSLISGRDPPFTVNGADVSAHFIDGQLQGRIRYGYVDLDKTPLEGLNKSSNSSGDALNYLKTEIKQETASDNDESKKDSSKADPNLDPEDPHKDYKGDEDFDVTLTELIVLEKCYFDYVNRTTNDINCNQMPENSCIEYEDDKSGIIMDVDCPLCSSKYENTQAFTMHMNKMHCVKLVPLYTCRVCASTFDNQAELESHVAIELGNFDDLWICQFCDKEFDNREATRRHLTEHWEVMEYDNCFSPHLGFKCRFCPTLFWNENDRESHQVRSHFSKYKDQFYKCESCSEIFSDKVWFIHHHLEKHFANKMTTYLLKCCLCCIVLPNIDEMRSHFLEEHPEARKVYCSLDMCQYKPLSHRKSFKLHVKTIHNPSTRAEKAVSCAVCGREFASSRACGAHMAQVHGPGKFKCKLCRDVLHTLDERKLHYLLRHPGRHPYECADCGKSFQYKSSLYMHRQDHAPNKQSFTCSYCGKVFMKKDSFREHVQIHEGPRHACSYCPMRFVQRSNMLRHERRHTGERPYACPHCPRTFADKGACNSHVRTHSKETSFACLYCGQTFVQKSKLTYHIRKHTGENLETCPVCSKLFTSGCALREHMKIHIAKKELVKCPLCDRKYQDERYMLRHLRTTHTGAHHTCPLCHKLLTSAPGLRHHVLTHSAVNLFHCKCCQKSYAIKRTMIKHLRKRHGLKGTEINIKDFFKKLDPRECQLGLDEETMTSIFGPPKKVMTDILIGDYVTFANNFNNSQSNDQDDGENTEEDSREDAREDEQSAEEDYKYYNENRDDTADGKREVEIENVSIKQEAIATEVELEPTDFVSVKIEPYDENESN